MGNWCQDKPQDNNNPHLYTESENCHQKDIYHKRSKKAQSANKLFWRVAVSQLDDYLEASTYCVEKSIVFFSTGLMIVGVETSIKMKSKRKGKHWETLNIKVALNSFLRKH